MPPTPTSVVQSVLQIASTSFCPSGILQNRPLLLLPVKKKISGLSQRCTSKLSFFFMLTHKDPVSTSLTSLFLHASPYFYITTLFFSYVHSIFWCGHLYTSFVESRVYQATIGGELWQLNMPLVYRNLGRLLHTPLVFVCCCFVFFICEVTFTFSMPIHFYYIRCLLWSQ